MHIVHLGDCRDVLASIADNSIDSIVTDPPYELGFMGKSWDSTGIAYDVTVWQQCLRVLKPGGHLIAFGGSRTYHRMAVAIEDAGFEIRDQIQWIYGSGFPKSLDVSKAMDKHGGVRAEFTAFRDAVIEALKRNGQTRSQLQEALGNFMISHYLTAGSQPAVPNYRDYCIIRDFCRLGNEWDDLFSPPAERTVVTEKREDMFGEYEATKKYDGDMGGFDGMRLGQSKATITAPATDLAKQWQGWGTALKPAHEPAVLARKPLCGTVADNVTTWGVGAINVDATRVGTEGARNNGRKVDSDIYGKFGPTQRVDYNTGRWPANVIFDEEAAQVLDGQSGHSDGMRKNNTINHFVSSIFSSPSITARHPDSGGASRFFYVAKASKSEREAGLDSTDGRANHHPTVKPIALMRYLVRMVTPKGGIVLDPFTGSGSTGCAAVLEGCDFVGMDITPEYVEIAQKRIAYYAVESPLLL